MPTDSTDSAPVATYTPARMHRYAKPTPPEKRAEYEAAFVEASDPSTPPERLRAMLTTSTAVITVSRLVYSRDFDVPLDADPLAAMVRNPNTPPDILAFFAPIYPDEFLTNPVVALLPLEDPAFTENVRDWLPLLRRAAMPPAMVRIVANASASSYYMRALYATLAANHASAGDMDPNGSQWRHILRRQMRAVMASRVERDTLYELTLYEGSDGLRPDAVAAIHDYLRHIGAGPPEVERITTNYRRRYGGLPPRADFSPFYRELEGLAPGGQGYNPGVGWVGWRLSRTWEYVVRQFGLAAVLRRLAEDPTIPESALLFIVRQSLTPPSLTRYAAVRSPSATPAVRRECLLGAFRTVAMSVYPYDAHARAAYFIGWGAGPDSLYWTLWQVPTAFDESRRFARLGIALNPDAPPDIRRLLAQKDGDRLIRAAARTDDTGEPSCR